MLSKAFSICYSLQKQSCHGRLLVDSHSGRHITGMPALPLLHSFPQNPGKAVLPILLLLAALKRGEFIEPGLVLEISNCGCRLFYRRDLVGDNWYLKPQMWCPKILRVTGTTSTCANENSTYLGLLKLFQQLKLIWPAMKIQVQKLIGLQTVKVG